MQPAARARVLTYGFGGALVLHLCGGRIVCLRSQRRSAWPARVALGCVLLYGAKVIALQVARDASPAWRRKVKPQFAALAAERRGRQVPVHAAIHKIPLNLGTAALLALYALPLHALASRSQAAAPLGGRGCGARAGEAASCTLASPPSSAAQGGRCSARHRFRFKRRRPPTKPAARRGAVALLAPPEPAADALFHGGIAAAALAACRSAALAWLSALAPAACAGVVVGRGGVLARRAPARRVRRAAGVPRVRPNDAAAAPLRPRWVMGVYACIARARGRRRRPGTGRIPDGVCLSDAGAVSRADEVVGAALASQIVGRATSAGGRRGLARRPSGGSSASVALLGRAVVVTARRARRRARVSRAGRRASGRVGGSAPPSGAGGTTRSPSPRGE